MRKYMLTAALVAAGLPLSPSEAREMDGFVVRSTVMRAGPDYDYPALQRLRPDSGIIVHGCLRDWNWCDISNRHDRGWVARQDIVVSYQGRRRGISASLGIGILSFALGNYWDNYYQGRPFYAQRPRWEQQYNNNYRPAWGPRSTAPGVVPQLRPPEQRQPGAGGQRGGRRQGQPAPNRQIVVPAAPQVAPQQPQRGAWQRQATPQQLQAKPEMRTNPNAQTVPNNGNSGQHSAPDKQHDGQREHGQNQPNKDRNGQD